MQSNQQHYARPARSFNIGDLSASETADLKSIAPIAESASKLLINVRQVVMGDFSQTVRSTTAFNTDQTSFVGMMAESVDRIEKANESGALSVNDVYPERRRELERRVADKQWNYDVERATDLAMGLKEAPAEPAAPAASAAPAVSAAPSTTEAEIAALQTFTPTDEQLNALTSILRDLLPEVQPSIRAGNSCADALRNLPDSTKTMLKAKLVLAGFPMENQTLGMVIGTVMVVTLEKLVADIEVSTESAQESEATHAATAAAAEQTAAEEPSQSVYGRFMEIFNSIEKKMDFNPAWMDADDLFSPAVFNPMLSAWLSPGDMATTIDSNNRAVIFIGTRHGVAVVFTRYPMGDDNDVITRNVPSQFAKLNLLNAGLTGPMSHEGLDEFFGDSNSFNIGNRELQVAEANGRKKRR